MKPHKPKHKVPMTPPQLVSVINQSKRVTEAEAEAMTLAVGKQLAQDVAPFYGLVPALEFVRSGGQPSPGGCPCYLLDTPDVDGALGYHDEDELGVAYIKVFSDPTLDGGGTVLRGSLSISAVLSHEVLELTGDSPANKWVDGPGGADYALELCDACEGDAYEVDGVAVSNFLLPAFFDPRAEHGSRFDFMGKLRRPFSMTPGGYQITRTEPGKVTQVFAAAHREEAAPGVHVHFGPEFPAWRRATKTHRASARRGRRSE